MSEQYRPNLGELCLEDARRDAVHIAVAPVVAAEELLVGQAVLLTKDGKATHAYADDEAIGIVDPFLEKNVKEGQTFWLFLYPNTITNLRHVWSHPAFVAKPPEKNKEVTPQVKVESLPANYYMVFDDEMSSDGTVDYSFGMVTKEYWDKEQCLDDKGFPGHDKLPVGFYEEGESMYRFRGSLQRAKVVLAFAGFQEIDNPF